MSKPDATKHDCLEEADREPVLHEPGTATSVRVPSQQGEAREI